MKNTIKYLDTSIFAIQETHFAKKGKLKLDKFHIFEAIRKSKQKGGSMLGIHVDLQPVLINEYSSHFELIVAEIKVGNTPIRVITGYGPQEGWDEDDRLPFFEALEAEVAAAEIAGRSIIICMDANSKLGSEYIKHDPYDQTKNGKLLADIIDRHALIVLNGLKEKCSGLFTRDRPTVDGHERSVIDFVILSSDLVKHLEYLHIDDKRLNVLTKTYIRGKGNNRTTIKVESDHNVLDTKINIPWKITANNTIEVFNFKDKQAQEKFFQATNNTNELINIFNNDKPIAVQTKKLIKRINGFIHQCFKKVRISTMGDNKLEDLYNKRRYYRSKNDNDNLEIIENKLAEMYSEKMYSKIQEEVKGYNTKDGGFNPGHL